jgi:hypothetical protein
MQHIGTAEYDVISFISLYVPKKNAVRWPVADPEFGGEGSVSKGLTGEPGEGKHKLVFLAKTSQDGQTEEIKVSINGHTCRFRIGHLEKFYTADFLLGKNESLKITLHPPTGSGKIRLKDAWVIRN